MFDLILLDRDGVINADSPAFIKSPAEWTPLPGSLQAIAALNASGRRVGVCSNQSGIGRGLFTRATLHRIHRRMHDELAKEGGHLDLLTFCPHHPDDGCACRKPLPGMLHLAMRLTGVPPARTCFVGDADRDLAAAGNAGCTPVLVRTGHGLQTEPRCGLSREWVFDDLAAFANAMAAR